MGYISVPFEEELSSSAFGAKEAEGDNRPLLLRLLAGFFLS